MAVHPPEQWRGGLVGILKPLADGIAAAMHTHSGPIDNITGRAAPVDPPAHRRKAPQRPRVPACRAAGRPRRHRDGTHPQRAGPPGTTLVTASLTTDFPGSAKIDDWVQGYAEIRRVGRRLAFTSCEFHANDRLVLAASGVFATTPRTVEP